MLLSVSTSAIFSTVRIVDLATHTAAHVDDVNGRARAANWSAVGDDALNPFARADGTKPTPQVLPRTVNGVLGMNDAALTAALQFYGESVAGAVVTKRRRLGRHLGCPVIYNQ